MLSTTIINPLFLAVSISDKNIQKKAVQEGMNLYIDIKGKKKENRGIEFPAKIEDVPSVEKMRLFGLVGASLLYKA
jgi:hypothetical protein